MKPQNKGNQAGVGAGKNPGEVLRLGPPDLPRVPSPDNVRGCSRQEEAWKQGDWRVKGNVRVHTRT